MPDHQQEGVTAWNIFRRPEWHGSLVMISSIGWMINRWGQGEPVTPRPRWVDNEYNPEGYPALNGDITFEKGLWRTYQYLERISYRELISRHAKLEIDRLQLPETVLASVGKSNPQPLGSIIDIPRESIANEAMGKLYESSIGRIIWSNY